MGRGWHRHHDRLFHLTLQKQSLTKGCFKNFKGLAAPSRRMLEKSFVLAEATHNSSEEHNLFTDLGIWWETAQQQACFSRGKASPLCRVSEVCTLGRLGVSSHEFSQTPCLEDVTPARAGSILGLEWILCTIYGMAWHTSSLRAGNIVKVGFLGFFCLELLFSSP